MGDQAGLLRHREGDGGQGDGGGDGTEEASDEVLSFYSSKYKISTVATNLWILYFDEVSEIFLKYFHNITNDLKLPFLPSGMLFSGVIQLAQKLATQHGACQALTAFWKHSMGNYHENGKVKYK